MKPNWPKGTRLVLTKEGADQITRPAGTGATVVTDYDSRTSGDLVEIKWDETPEFHKQTNGLYFARRFAVDERVDDNAYYKAVTEGVTP